MGQWITPLNTAYIWLAVKFSKLASKMFAKVNVIHHISVYKYSLLLWIVLSANFIQWVHTAKYCLHSVSSEVFKASFKKFAKVNVIYPSYFCIKIFIIIVN